MQFDPTLPITEAQYREIDVTPEMANLWLQRNVRNRSLRTTVIQRYANDMAANRWTFTGEAIKFAADGTLLDGQHRLQAIRLQPHGFSLRLPVIAGLSIDAQMNMDQGVKRTSGDQLGLVGVKNANNIAAIARIALIYSGGALFRDSKYQTTLTSSSTIEQWVNENQEYVDLINTNLRIIRNTLAPISVSGAAFLLFAQIDKDEAIEFFDGLARKGCPRDSPITVLDVRLQRIRTQMTKTNTRDYLALFIQAWNACRESRSLTKFQRPRGGVWSAETFPEPK